MVIRKSFYALALCLMTASLKAGDPVTEHAKGNVKFVFESGHIKERPLTTKEKWAEFGCKSGTASMVAFTSKALVMFLPWRDELRPYLEAGIAVALHMVTNPVLTIELFWRDPSQWKKRETWEALAAIALGQTAAHYGGDIAKNAVDYFKPTAANSNVSPLKP